MRNKRLHNTLKLTTSGITDLTIKDKLHNKFTSLQINKELAVEAFRAATKAKLAADIKKAEAEQQLLGLLEEAGEHFEEIRREPIWFVYMKDGEIVFENPFSERDMRNAVRMHRAQLDKQIEDLSDDGNDDLYESDSEN